MNLIDSIFNIILFVSILVLSYLIFNKYIKKYIKKYIIKNDTITEDFYDETGSGEGEGEDDHQEDDHTSSSITPSVDGSGEGEGEDDHQEDDHTSSSITPSVDGSGEGEGEQCKDVNTEENVLKYINNNLTNLTKKIDFLTGYKSLQDKTDSEYFKSLDNVDTPDLITKILSTSNIYTKDELENLSNSSEGEGETNNESLKNIAKTIYLLVNKKINVPDLNIPPPENVNFEPPEPNTTDLTKDYQNMITEANLIHDQISNFCKLKQDSEGAYDTSYLSNDTLNYFYIDENGELKYDSNGTKSTPISDIYNKYNSNIDNSCECNNLNDNDCHINYNSDNNIFLDNILPNVYVSEENYRGINEPVKDVTKQIYLNDDFKVNKFTPYLNEYITQDSTRINKCKLYKKIKDNLKNGVYLNYYQSINLNDYKNEYDKDDVICETFEFKEGFIY